MNELVMLLGNSLSFAGIGGLLSGIFSHSLRRAMIWAVGFGVLETVLLLMVSPTSRYVPGFILIAIFWGLIGWFAVGRFSAKRRATKALNTEG